MRSSWKGVCSFHNLYSLKNKEKVLLSRNIVLTPFLVNMASIFLVHNGKSVAEFDSKGVGIGFKVGAFNFTRLMGMRIHTVNKRTSKKK